MAVQKAKLLTNVAIFIVSGVLAAFGQPDRGALVSILALLFGYSGIFFLLKNSESGKFWLAFLWAFGVFAFQLRWIATTHYHGPGIVAVYLCVALLFAVQFAFLFGWGISSRFSISRGICLASIWALLEWSRLYYFCGFPFSPVGLVLTFNPIPMQIASIVGVYGLSFIVIFISYLIAFLQVKLVACCFAIVSAFGWMHLQYWERLNVKAPYYHVALVQTGLTVEQKEVMSIEKQWERILAFLLESKKSHFDLIVLPEVALTRGDKSFHLEMAKKLADVYQSEVVIGLIDDAYNAAFHIIPDCGIYERYEKRVLVPVAEYLPFLWMKPF